MMGEVKTKSPTWTLDIQLEGGKTGYEKERERKKKKTKAERQGRKYISQQIKIRIRITSSDPCE
jgi:hypothetical protein